MIKYELKKLFSNKFVIASFVLIALLVIASAIYSYSIYKNNRTSAPFVLLQKDVLPDTTVTKNNINDFIDRYNEIKENDDNYAYVDDSKRDNGLYLHGKYAEKMRSYSGKNRLTAEEAAELNRISSYQINDEMYPEYAALHYIINDFKTKHQNIDPDFYVGTEGESSAYESDEDKSSLIYTQGYTLRDKYQVENGITYGRNFGWSELMDTGSLTVPLIIAVAAAIAAIIMFTGEYTAKTDALIMASKKGKIKIVHVKLLAGMIFSVIITLYYFTVMLISYGCLFSLDGINTSSYTFINGRLLTYGEAFILMILCTLFCIISITVTALAVSAMCTKTLPAVLLVFVITLLPFLINFAFYIPNDTIREILNLLPSNALLLDFGYSHYYLIGSKTVIESHLYIIPAVAAQALLFTPVLYIGWKKHRISN